MKKIPVLLAVSFFLTAFSFNLSYSQSADSAESSSQETPPDSETKSVSPAGQEDSAKAPKSLSEKMAKKVSLDLRSMGIIDTLNFLAKEGNLNIVATNNVKGRVTLFLKNVAIKDMLDIIMFTHDLAMVIDNNVITIMTEKEYEAIHGEEYTDKRAVETIQLKYADPAKVGDILEGLKSTIGKIIIDPNTATILLMDTPPKIEAMKEAIKRVDIPTVKRVVPTETKAFELDYAEVADIEDQISECLEEDIGSVQADTRTNTFVVKALPHNMRRVEKLIEAFDAQTKSVFIDAQILELTISDDYYYGLDWSKIFRSSDDLQLDGVFPFTSSGSSFMKLTMGELASTDYDATIQVLKDIGEVKIVSSPQIYVNNNQEAQFMVGSREAYVTTTTTTGEATTTTSESVEFIDVGVNLYVTPVINKQGYVRLHIKPEVSSVRDWLETTEGNEIPIVETSNVETDVLVKDGQTIIMAGLIKESQEKEEKKLPLFGDIPFLGNAFKSVKKEKERKELVILLTPSVITGMSQVYKQPKEKKGEPVKKEKAEPIDKREDKTEKKEKEEKESKEIKNTKTTKEAKVITKTKPPKKTKSKNSAKEALFQKYHQLGLNSEKKGNYRKALAAYKKALEVNPDSAIIHLHLADVYQHHLGKPQAAELHFRRYKVLKQLLNLEDMRVPTE
ncbi:MAG: tetratricopeptide repeat protein [Candidatus Omnitrophica bacterium]|nr:tetratricopeptide repeat protein [Candidatus Omnitrophota bacterium]